MTKIIFNTYCASLPYFPLFQAFALFKFLFLGNILPRGSVIVGNIRVYNVNTFFCGKRTKVNVMVGPFVICFIPLKSTKHRWILRLWGVRMGVLIQLVRTDRKRKSLNVFVCVILAWEGQNFGHFCMRTKRVIPRILLELSKSSLST